MVPGWIVIRFADQSGAVGMAILRDDDLRFRRLSRKIGVFLSVAALIAVLALIFVGVHKGLFTPKTHVFFITDSGRDIQQGMAAKLSGFNIGRVRKLELTAQATVRVTLEINDEYMHWVRKDSKARLLKEGVIGDTIIEITPGSEQSAALAKDEEIGFEREVGVGQLIDQLYEDVRPLLQDLRSVARRADAVLAGLPGTREKLDAAITSAQRNFENLEKVTASELPATVRGGREVVESSKKVVDSVGRTWPFNGGIEQPKAGAVPLDSVGGGSNGTRP
jgi:phospholipid/cholesterol/gamma-HCH transport system substrate-binding protein